MTIHLLRPLLPTEHRSALQLWEHYRIERELAARLRNASRVDRRTLYGSAYDELFSRVPDHPQLMRKELRTDHAAEIELQLRFLRRFLSPDRTFLEIGAGDCALSFAVAEHVRHVYAVDVSEQITHSTRKPVNFSLSLTDGTSVPVPPNSIDVAYSNQLMEHLHPDDAIEQLHNIHAALAPGGCYVCVTPNRLTGPHDISRYFETEASGFHLREYTCSELVSLMRKVGFSRAENYLQRSGTFRRIPLPLTRAAELPVRLCPALLRTRIADNRIARALLSIRLVAFKSAA